MGVCVCVCMQQTDRSRERRIPCDWAVKLLAMAVLVVEFPQKLVQMAQEMMLMIPEQLQHPYEVLVKAEPKKL